MRKTRDILKCAPEDIFLDRDEDVLDTWFSSRVPFSVWNSP
jgi:valyl-tRNA synthetase